MSFLRCALLLLACVLPVGAQPFGLSNRVGNASLRLPSTPPTYSYALTNAFGNLTFANPVCMAAPPGEVNRLFVVEQAGRVAVITNLAVPTRTVFLDISAKVIGGSGGGEEGMLGMAFHPGYATNGFFFLYYTDETTTKAGAGRHQILSRFQVSGNNPNAALAGSEVSLLTMFDEHSDHNGGDLHFGPDGFLYVSLGDEGEQNDSLNNSQRIDKDFWSSILRLDVDVPARGTSLLPNAHPANTNHVGRVIHYRIPADNPFVGATTFNGAAVNAGAVRTEMFAVGFRNPWRFSIDDVTGRIFCGDVGDDALEEISVITKGGNYGWAFREATNAGPKAASQPGGLTLTPPIFSYRHGTATNQGNAVVGGRVYRGGRIPALNGSYIFGDFVSGNIWSLRHDGTNVSSFIRIADDPGVAAFGVDPSNGDVLTADQNNDTIKRLIAVPAAANSLPATLADAGVFTNLTALAPHAGFVAYDVNLPFWSDNAIKSRWFHVPTNRTITFGATNNWLFPTGTVWVKHFELELTNGVAESRRRLETRLLVRHGGTDGSDVYGVTYRWGGSLTNATLVPEGGLDETFVIHDGGTMRTQVWRYPSRSECLHCHTRASQGGLALGFHTPQLNRDFQYGGVTDNQLRAMNHAGYFSMPISNLYSLRALARLDDDTVSVEQRVR
ncbi:MAG: PQQ-dependent sugar dehydrogenase, partial [Planctomycetia bacterium]|nr:PQQ-dependent sugar dehydrogenase [Planctomycetia bacterium]